MNSSPIVLFHMKISFFSNILSVVVSGNSFMLKFVLHDKYFFDFFFEVQIWYFKTFEFRLGRSFRKIKKIPAKILLFLTIVTVNKNLKCIRKFCRQLWSLYFENFWCFTKFSFRLTLNEALLLVTNCYIYKLPQELPNDLRLKIFGN